MESLVPPGEAERPQALTQYSILDTPPEEALDDLARAAAQVCGPPIALVSFVDAHRQWFKARVGLPLGATPREAASCAHAILAMPGLAGLEATARIVKASPGTRVLAPSRHSTEEHVLQALQAGAAGASPGPPVTARQREVLQPVAEGNTTKDISQVMERLGIHDVAGLARDAVRKGIVPPEA